MQIAMKTQEIATVERVIRRWVLLGRLRKRHCRPEESWQIYGSRCCFGDVDSVRQEQVELTPTRLQLATSWRAEDSFLKVLQPLC